MQFTQAIETLNQVTFDYVEKSVPNHVGEYATYWLDESQFFTLLPRISGCGFKPTLEETVSYIKEREAKLCRLYEDYNSNPYCSTWWHLDQDNSELTFGYETSSGTVIEMTYFANSENTTYCVELPCSRLGGSHSGLINMVLAGATPQLLDIKHSFYCVEQPEYEIYRAWWNSTRLGEKLPEWEEYDRQRKEADIANQLERAARHAKIEATGVGAIEEDYSDCGEYNYDDDFVEID